MTLQITLIRRTVLLCAFTMIAGLVGAQTRSPQLLVVLRGENSLAIIDPASGKVMGRVPTGNFPHNVAASADGKLAFVTNQMGDSISVIDIAARKELRRVNLGPGSRPHGVLFSGGKVYFTADGYKLVGCYDPTSNQIDWLQGTGQNGMGLLVVSQDAKRIFAANDGSDNIISLERVPEDPPARIGYWSITVIPVGKGPEGIDISPDGKEVWTAQQDDGAVSIIDVATSKVTQTLNLQTKRSNRLRFTPDGKLVLISDRNGGELLVLDAASRKEVKRLKFDTRPTEIMMTPDGSRAYVSLPGINTVATIDLRTLEVTSRISSLPNPEGMAWVETR